MEETLDFVNNSSLNIIFLGHVLKYGNPNILLFTNLLEIYKNNKSLMLDRKCLAYEIFSIFFHEQSPLPLTISVHEKKRILDVLTEETDDQIIKSMYDVTKKHFWPEINLQFNDFLKNHDPYYHKYFNPNNKPLSNSQADFMLVIGNYCDHLITSYMTTNNAHNTRDSQRAILMCLELILGQYSIIKEEYNINFEFLRKVTNKKIRASSCIVKKSNSLSESHHLWTPVRLKKTASCAFCTRLVWGTAPQGTICIDCDLVIHYHCQHYFIRTCVCKEPSLPPCEMSDELSRRFFNKISRKKVILKNNSRNELRLGSSFDVSSVRSNTRFKNMIHSIEIKSDHFEVDSDMEYTSHMTSLDPHPDESTDDINKKEIIKELIHTERWHLRILKIMNNAFYIPLQKLEYDPHFTKKLFSCLTCLIVFHDKVVQKLKQLKNEFPLIQVYEAFASLFNDDNVNEFKEACATFSCDYQHNIQCLKDKMESNIKLYYFIISSESNELCRKMQLKDMLSAQFMRMVKYPLLFERLLKYIQSDTSEYSQWSNLATNAHKCIKFSNIKVAEVENRRYLERLRTFYDMKTQDTSIPIIYKNMDPNGLNLLFYGDLTWKIHKRSIDCHGLVFENDLVLLTKTENSRYVLRSYKDNDQTNNLCVSPVIELNSNTLVRDLVIEKNCFLLILKKKSQLMKLTVKDGNVKENWINMLMKLITSQNKLRMSTPNIQIMGTFLNITHRQINVITYLEEMTENLKNLMGVTDSYKKKAVYELITNLNSFIDCLDWEIDTPDDSHCFPDSSLNHLRRIIRQLKHMVFDNINIDATYKIIQECKNNFKILEEWSSSNSLFIGNPVENRRQINESKFVNIRDNPNPQSFGCQLNVDQRDMSHKESYRNKNAIRHKSTIFTYRR